MLVNLPPVEEWATLSDDELMVRVEQFNLERGAAGLPRLTGDQFFALCAAIAAEPANNAKH